MHFDILISGAGPAGLCLAQALSGQGLAIGLERGRLHEALAVRRQARHAEALGLEALGGREHGVVVIDGGCPLMFGPAADGAHKAMCAVLKLMGRVPRTVS